MTEFTPWMSLGGGMLIGLAAVLLMGTLGRIMGATGVLQGFIFPANREDWAWRAALLAGMVSAPAAYWAINGAPMEIAFPVSMTEILVGGVIVGVGVTLGAGCTSGHGVCGLARRSPRSLVATVTFMAATFVTVFVIRHLIGV